MFQRSTEELKIQAVC